MPRYFVQMELVCFYWNKINVTFTGFIIPPTTSISSHFQKKECCLWLPVPLVLNSRERQLYLSLCTHYLSPGSRAVRAASFTFCLCLILKTLLALSSLKMWFSCCGHPLRKLPFTITVVLVAQGCKWSQATPTLLKVPVWISLPVTKLVVKITAARSP